MSDIFREVDDELRQDKMRKFWNKHGWLIVIGALSIVLSVAGVRGYQSWDRMQSGGAGADFVNAIDLLNGEDASEGRALLEKMSHGSYENYPVLAKIRNAAALNKLGAREDAIMAYDAVVGDQDIDPILRDVARIRAAFILVDTASPDEMRERIMDLAKAENPWRHSARELIALSYYRIGAYADADKEYDRLMSDLAVPVGPRGRAEMMRALIAPHLASPG